MLVPGPGPQLTGCSRAAQIPSHISASKGNGGNTTTTIVVPPVGSVHGQREDIRAISEQIVATNLEVARRRKLLLKEEIDAHDFREIERENEKKIEMLEVRLIEASRVSINIEPLLKKAVSNLAHLNELYKEGDVKRKQVIISSIVPKNSLLAVSVIEPQELMRPSS
jgi:hypothetical protein